MAAFLVAARADAAVVRDRQGDVEIALEVAPSSRVCFTWPRERFDARACSGLKIQPFDAPPPVPSGGSPVAIAVVRRDVPDDEARGVFTIVRLSKELPAWRPGGEQDFARGMHASARADTSLPGRLREGFDAKMVSAGGTDLVRVVLERDVPPDSNAHWMEHRVIHTLRVPGGAYTIDWTCRREHAAVVDEAGDAAVRTLEIARTAEAKPTAPKSTLAEHATAILAGGACAGLVALAVWRSRRARTSMPRATRKKKRSRRGTPTGSA